MYDTLNRSINETLPRSVLTHTHHTGRDARAPVLRRRGAASVRLVMTFGVFVATFSSIYVASPTPPVDRAPVPARRPAVQGARDGRAGACGLRGRERRAPGRPGSGRGVRRRPGDPGAPRRRRIDGRPTPGPADGAAMAPFVDSHAHLADPAFDGRSRRGDRARARRGCASPSCASASPSPPPTRARRHRGASSGLRLRAPPASIRMTPPRSMPRAIWTRLRASRCRGAVAVGECGLDYHYDHSPREAQREAFAAQLGLAADTGRPVVVHTREADDDTAAMLGDAARRRRPRRAPLLHGPARARRASRSHAGWFVSFSGIVTFQKWNDDDLLRAGPGRPAPRRVGCAVSRAGPAPRKAQRARVRARARSSDLPTARDTTAARCRPSCTARERARLFGLAMTVRA